MEPRSAQLRRGLAEVRARIAAAAALHGRAASPPALLPVTKSLGVEDVIALARILAAEAPASGTVTADPQGVPARARVAFGENRLGDLETKARALAERGVDVEWHYVGHLQRNKVRRIARIADVVHSVDSLALVGLLDSAAKEHDKQLGVYVQVDLTGDAHKTGLAPEAAHEVWAAVRDAPHLVPLGLMAMGPRVETGAVTTAAVFEAARELAGELRGAGLSLGMSADLELAVAAGSTLLRIGSDLFAHLEANAPCASEDPEDPEVPADGTGR